LKTTPDKNDPTETDQGGEINDRPGTLGGKGIERKCLMMSSLAIVSVMVTLVEPNGRSSPERYQRG
jgi:hypothetical protein